MSLWASEFGQWRQDQRSVVFKIASFRSKTIRILNLKRTTHSSAHSTSRFKGRGCKCEDAGDIMNAMASYDEAFNNSYHTAEETMTFSSLKVSFRCWSTFGPFSPPGVAHITFWQWWSGQTRLNSKNFDVSFRWCRRLGQSAIHRKMQRKNGPLNMRVMTKLSKMK